MIFILIRLEVQINRQHMQEPQSMVINEEEKEGNPIFKVVFNKIRNLKKKLAQIQHIKTLDRKSLKLAQINKLQKEREILQEIQKNEEFARYYKTILIENNLSYDKVDDLLKVSTLLAIGKRIQDQDYCPPDTKQVYQGFYYQFFEKNAENSMTDQVIRIYHLLWNYLQNDVNYSQCRDYITYMQEFDRLMQQQKGNKLMISPPLSAKTTRQSDSQTIKDMMGQIDRKMMKLEIQSEIFKIYFDKSLEVKAVNLFQANKIQIQKIDGLLDKDNDNKHQCSTANPEGEHDVAKNILEQFASENQEKVLINNPHSSIQQPYSQLHSDNGGLNTNGKSRAQKNRQRKNRKNNKKMYYEVELNIRKCSDTSLQPTPQKMRGKIKYMQKKY